MSSDVTDIKNLIIFNKIINPINIYFFKSYIILLNKIILIIILILSSWGLASYLFNNNIYLINKFFLFLNNI